MSTALAFAAMFLLSVLATPLVYSQTLTILHSFDPGTGDGDFPQYGLLNVNGILYGTTAYGGDFGTGTLFGVGSNGGEPLLISLHGRPACPLIVDSAGNFYGTTEFGGTYNRGTIFKVDSTGTLSVLHSFAPSPDGKQPRSGLLMDSAGNMYGTTSAGGVYGSGTIFKIDASDIETVLYSFTGRDDGAKPGRGTLVADTDGNLYGTTEYGGLADFGTVFKLDPTGNETVLHSFSGLDGRQSPTGVIIDGRRDLYGTTQEGGAHNSGTVFTLDSAGIYTVLYSFGGANGYNLWSGLVRDRDGNLYGTTQWGGANGFGTVFKISGKHQETVLYSFTGVPDGSYPIGDLIMDHKGDLFGTTFTGGTRDGGTVFKLTLPGARK